VSKKAEQVGVDKSPPVATLSMSRTGAGQLAADSAASKAKTVITKDNSRTTASQSAATDGAAGKAKTVVVKENTETSPPPPKKTKRVYCLPVCFVPFIIIQIQCVVVAELAGLVSSFSVFFVLLFRR